MGWPKTGRREAARGCPWSGRVLSGQQSTWESSLGHGKPGGAKCAWKPGPPLRGTFLPCGGDYFSAVGHRIALGTARIHAHARSPRPDITRIHSGVLGASHLPRMSQHLPCPQARAISWKARPPLP